MFWLGYFSGMLTMGILLALVVVYGALIQGSRVDALFEQAHPSRDKDLWVG